jgi:hypothetical protein
MSKSRAVDTGLQTDLDTIFNSCSYHLAFYVQYLNRHSVSVVHKIAMLPNHVVFVDMFETG